MKILTVIVKNTNQAKLTLQHNSAIIKIPDHLTENERIELRNKMLHIIDNNTNNKQYLKMYYKIGTPYMFLNKKVSRQKRETHEVYKWNEI